MLPELLPGKGGRSHGILPEAEHAHDSLRIMHVEANEVKDSSGQCLAAHRVKGIPCSSADSRTMSFTNDDIAERKIGTRPCRSERAIDLQRGKDSTSVGSSSSRYWRLRFFMYSEKKQMRPTDQRIRTTSGKDTALGEPKRRWCCVRRPKPP